MKFLAVLASVLALTIASPLPEAAPEPDASSLNVILLAIINAFPAISGAVSDVANLIAASQKTLAAITGVSTTQNGLSGSCKAMTVIFARGTADPGNIGFLVGPALYQALQDKIGSAKVSFQGVPYPASIAGFLAGGDPSGATAMASLVDQAYTKCPDTKVVLVGYSQGGQIVHNAADIIPAATMEKISSVIIFGDPENGTPVTNAAAKTTIFCHTGDNICEQGDIILLPHLVYATKAVQGATYAVKMAGL